MEALNCGIGDWLFRQAAFPELPDKTETYFQRFFPRRDAQLDMLIRQVLEKRRGFSELLDRLIAAYGLDQADLVGFTSMFAQNVASFAMARRLKERNPRIVTVMGGANCETTMGQEIAKHVKQIDFAFSGPALKSFPEFVGNCLNHEFEKNDRIQGVFSKANCALVQIGHGALGEDLDIDVPIELDYEPFLNALESNFPGNEIKPSILFETARGCWWGERAHCTFCGLNGLTMKYRAMGSAQAIAQFDSLFKKYSSRCARFESVDNILERSYLKDVLPFINTPEHAHIFYEVKADLSEADVQVLSKARVKFIQPGVESLSTSTLKLMKKGTSAFQNLTLLKNCALYDISPTWNLLIGFPGEAEDVYKKYLRDIPLLIHLPPPTGVYPVRFDRYSPYFVQAKQYGLDLYPYDFYEMIYPFSNETVANLAYYFVDRNYNAQYIMMMTKWIDKLKERVGAWWARWHGSDRAVHPMVFFKDNGTRPTIYDSRSGKVIEHEVSEIGKQVLEHLTKPRKIADLASDLSQIPNFNPEAEVASLRDRGLVFEEGERFLSLVFPKQPPPVTSIDLD
jgi:ribosomal peptide maturation radical SAM protein 1